MISYPDPHPPYKNTRAIRINVCQEGNETPRNIQKKTRLLKRVVERRRGISNQ